MIYRIEIYDVESEVINRILELRAEGKVSEDFFVFAKNQEQVFSLSKLRLVHTHTDEDDNFWERIKSFFKGEESALDTWNRMGLTKEEASRLEESIEQGHLLLILEKPDDLIGDEWKEYIPQDDPTWVERAKENPNYNGFGEANNLKDIPNDLISDIFPTGVNQPVDAKINNPKDEMTNREPLS
ncbi:MAG: general stress protein [Tissierellia bacterium]|nr:general stress protein [Tissierellia bacterium]